MEFIWRTMQTWVQIFLMFWPLILLAFIPPVVGLVANAYKISRLSKSGIAELDNMDGLEFERYLEILFKKSGYQVRRTPYQGDYGADLILRRENEEISVQAKRYKRAVGVKAVQEIVAAREYYRCNKAMVVTNSYFSQQARRLAQANNVELWDRNELANRLRGLNEEIPMAFAVPALAVVEKSPSSAAIAEVGFTCAQCGKTVSTRVHDFCLTNRSTFGGLVYCYGHQKDVRGSQ